MGDFNIPSRIQVALPTDEKGLTGRQCPSSECEGYFKVLFGTGLKGEDLPCHCPYCGHRAPQEDFATPEQIEYAQSVAMREITHAVTRELKKMEFDIRPSGPFGIGFSMRVKEGSPPPLRYYREKPLETEITCANCTLVYAVYGVFAFCPDCASHNSPEILDKNLEASGKMLALAAQVTEGDIREQLVGSALSSVVAAFDGFGREIVRVHADAATDPKQAANLSFQNLEGADDRLDRLFGFRLSSTLNVDQWRFAVRCFHKRHLLAHKMGVVDERYVEATGDSRAVIGRKVQVGSDEVRELMGHVRVLAQWVTGELVAKDHEPPEGGRVL